MSRANGPAVTAEALDVERIRRAFPVLGREVHGRPLVYLDNAATSQKPRAMIERLREVYDREYARVEKGHTLSRQATRAFEGTREKVARLIGAEDPPREVVFCRGATEALNLLLADGGSTMAERVSFTDVEAKPIPHKFEAGEPAFGEVEGWGQAIDYWTNLGLDGIAAYERDLAAYAVGRLSTVAGVRVPGDPEDRISVVSFTVEEREASDVEKDLDERGIAVRAENLEAQPLLEALGVDEAVRASFAFYNTPAEADALAEALEEIAGGG
jgi:selenocysteine lyase/cysteine desulfurase